MASSKIDKIRVGVVCETFQEAQKFINRLASDYKVVRNKPYTITTNCLMVTWIPAYLECFHGYRLSHVYTTEEIASSAWFKTIIRPMMIPGCGVINNSIKEPEQEKCTCFHEEYGKTVCYGTKEREECSCAGDKCKCNFYPEYRK